MKRLLMVTAAAAMTLGGTVAQAQSYGYGDRREYRQERREDRREYRQDRRDDRREYRQWRRGQVLAPHYRSPRYVVHDYGRYRLAAPPRGHQYYRNGNDILLTAVASGLIGVVIGSAFNGPQYAQPAPYYAAPVNYGYAPPPPPPVYQQPYPTYEAPYYPPRQDRN